MCITKPYVKITSKVAEKTVNATSKGGYGLFFCCYFYPTENEQEFLNLINDIYRVDDDYLSLSKEVNEMFR